MFKGVFKWCWNSSIVWWNGGEAEEFDQKPAIWEWVPRYTFESTKSGALESLIRSSFLYSPAFGQTLPPPLHFTKIFEEFQTPLERSLLKTWWNVKSGTKLPTKTTHHDHCFGDTSTITQLTHEHPMFLFHPRQQILSCIQFQAYKIMKPLL